VEEVYSHSLAHGLWAGKGEEGGFPWVVEEVVHEVGAQEVADPWGVDQRYEMDEDYYMDRKYF